MSLHGKKILILNIAIVTFIFMGCHPALKFASVQYDVAAMNRLLDSTKMDHLVFQFDTEDSKSYKNPFRLIAYSFDSLNHIIDYVPYQLHTVERTKPKSFSGKSILGNLTISRDDILKLVTNDSTHQRIKYDFLLLNPARDTTNNYIYYDMSASFLSPMVPPPSPPAIQRVQPCPPAKCFYQPE